MSYVAYEDITSPNEVVEHIAEYVKDKGYTIVQDYADDNDIYGGSITDGKKLVFKDKTGNYYINLRSCNGYQIFGSGDESYQDTLNADSFKDESLRGVGMTVSEGYSSATRWYNQYRVPNKFKTDELLGVYMPVPLSDEGALAEVLEPTPVERPTTVVEPAMPSYPTRPTVPLRDGHAQAEYDALLAQYNADIVAYNNTVNQINAQYAQDIQAYNVYLQELAKYNSYLEQLNLYNNYLSKLDEIKYKYTLFCNEVKNDGGTESTLIFSLMKSKGDWFQVSHLVVGNIDKYDVWNGGIFFSGSANRYNMKVANKLYSNSAKTLDSNIYPVLSSGKDTNTFLRIDIDNAPSDSRGNIRWASSGEDNITGKKLSLTIRTGNGTIPYGNGEILHFYYLQSHSRLDSGRNVNTLNCITLNLPIFMAVSVDPDDLQNYAAVGEVRGVYFISMFNLQTSSVYTINRSDSTESCQGFSVGRRRGQYGYDGISILQQDD